MVPTEFDKCTSIKLQTEIKNDPLKFDIFLRCLKDSYNIFNHTIYLKKPFSMPNITKSRVYEKSE